MMNIVKKLFAGALIAGLALSSHATITLKLSHNQNKTLPVHKAMQYFADKVEEYTHGDVKVRIYPNAQLGSQRESLELVQFGAISMAKSNAAELEAFEPLYGVLNLPYLFKDEKHYYDVLTGPIGEEILNASKDKGFIGITFYDAGSRSFYAGKPIRSPDDLKGMKIRVQPSPTAVKMVELLGASPTPIAFGELYTALQQGVVDGAENNESALVDNLHGEVAKYYSYDRHTMIPDVMVMSVHDWEKLTPEQQGIIKKAARESMMVQKQLWAENTAKVIQESKEKLGVTFINDVDTAAFAEKVAPMYEQAKKASPQAADLIQRILDLKNKPTQE
ncbi:MAG: TRAP transporter substrate-binding protein [Cardiobacteriaceae bacterium]|nr:TRAP transporter substrate-binding protein [Cardiobacteriaceae bacterium]